MAMVINTNIYSTIAQNSLTSANNALGKSIQRLSTGLRINSASDDASGLAISEKLRGQIRGMAKASMNAQDAISYLQTAEGGMQVIGDMLQRMRELAVQAGNGTYTTNDRAELQKEVDQLKDEINRIASSTEYNTKKLLTGQSSALWSTSNPGDLEAIVRGATVSGNYNIDIEAIAGQNYIYKSDIMSVEGVTRTVDTFDYSFNNSGQASGVSFSNVHGEITKKFDISINTYSTASTAGAITSATVTTIGKHTGKLQDGSTSTLDVTFTGSANATAQYVVIEALQDGDLTNSTNESAFKITTYNAETGEKDEYLLPATAIGAANTITVEGVGSFTLNDVTTFAEGDKIVFAKTAGSATPELTFQVGNGPVIGVDGTQDNANVQYAVLEMDDSGNISVGTGTFSVTGASATTSQVHGVSVTPNMVTRSVLELNAKESIGTTVNAANSRVIGGLYPTGVDVTVRKSDAIDVETAVATSGKYLQDLNLRIASTGDDIESTGSYVVEYINATNKNVVGDDTISGSETAHFKVTFVDAATGLSREIAAADLAYTEAAGTLEITDGSGSVTLTFSGTNAQLTKGDKVLVQTQAASAAGTNSANATVTVGNFTRVIEQKDLGNFSFHNVQMDSAGNIVQSRIDLSLADSTSGMLRFNTPESKVATLDTKLKDISLFTNADGRMVLDNTQEIQIVGNNKSVKIYMEGNDTVEDFRSKLNQALLDLGMGTGDETIDQNLVRYVTEEEAQASGNLAVAGTFVFQGAIAGDMSKIDFIGDQGVLDALSLATIQSGENSDLKITVSDAHNGKVIGSDTVSDGVLRGVIDNIDVKINNPQLITSYNATTGRMTFTSPVDAVRMQLHVADNRTEVQIGANEGQKFDTSIAQMDTTALEIDDALVNTMENSQKAITKFDQALSKVNGARATLGAQINRLEYTMQNLSVSRQNLIASESRIRDLDVAEETANFASKQVLVNAAVAMLAQANQLPQTALQLLRG